MIVEKTSSDTERKRLAAEKVKLNLEKSKLIKSERASKNQLKRQTEENVRLVDSNKRQNHENQQEVNELQALIDIADNNSADTSQAINDKEESFRQQLEELRTKITNLETAENISKAKCARQISEKRSQANTKAQQMNLLRKNNSELILTNQQLITN